MSLPITPPFSVFTGLDGEPIDGGLIYVGVANLDPVTNPVAIYYDDALTLPAPNPATVNAGYPVYAGAPSRLYTAGTAASVTVKDAQGVLVFSAPSLNAAGSVTSVAASGGTTGFAFTGGPITGAGTLTLTVSNAATARSAITAAASGANTDITSLEQDVAIVETGTAAANSIGFRGLPVVVSTGGTLQLSDAGKTVYTSGNITIPANASIAFPIGTAIEISNSTNATITISITSDTLRQSGTTNTGTRTLAVYGDCVIKKRTATVWYIAGQVT
jgi:hypothetical protein